MSPNTKKAIAIAIGLAGPGVLVLIRAQGDEVVVIGEPDGGVSVVDGGVPQLELCPDTQTLIQPGGDCPP